MNAIKNLSDNTSKLDTLLSLATASTVLAVVFFAVTNFLSF